MKFLKRLFAGFLLLLGLLILLAYIFDVDYLLKAVRTIYFKGHTTAFLEDYKAFDNRLVQAGQTVDWPLHLDYNTAAPTGRLQEIHERNGSIAYLIIRNDSIWYEAYYDGFDADSRTNSFSMAKSFISGLLGKAIMDGYIKSLDQPLGDFFPEYKDAATTVGDLSSMASGLDWDEAYYSPFSITTKAYFYDDLGKIMRTLDIVETPGKEFKYLSGNTQLLAMVIEEASGKKLADYFSESFWQPLGAKHDAYWQVDSEKHDLAKAYCCVASNARDFARFGKLYKDHGRYNGRQLLDSAFVAQSIRPRFAGAPYGYGFWLGDFQGKDFFAMRGHLGQYVITVPEDNVMIVRLGHSKGETDTTDSYTRDFWIYLEEGYTMLGM